MEAGAHRTGSKTARGLPGKCQGPEPKVVQMSDQANNLRQLVRAHRQWRELLEQPAFELVTQKGPAKDDQGWRQNRAETSVAGFALFAARTLDWVRAWRLRKVGGRRRDRA